MRLGSMVRHAARRGVQTLGVTLSRQQAEWGQKAIVNEGLQHLAEIRHLDYRDVPETGFDAISSIGLTEHIGVRKYPAYFRSLQRQAAARRSPVEPLDHPADNISRVKTEAFIDRYVFPDGEITGSGRIIMAMQDVGFDVRHSENLREHYALTLRDWCGNLRDGTGTSACRGRRGHRTGLGPVHGGVATEFRAQRDPAAPGARREAGAARAMPPCPSGPGGSADRPQRVTANPVAPPPAMAMTPDNARTGTGVQLSAVPPLPS